MRSRIYLSLAVVGFLVPMTLSGLYLGEYGIDLEPLWDAMTANAGIIGIVCDLLLSAVVFVYWASAESRRLEIPHLWISIVAMLIVGLCFAFPLFMYMRERALEANTSATA